MEKNTAWLMRSDTRKNIFFECFYEEKEKKEVLSMFRKKASAEEVFKKRKSALEQRGVKAKGYPYIGKEKAHEKIMKDWRDYASLQKRGERLTQKERDLKKKIEKKYYLGKHNKPHGRSHKEFDVLAEAGYLEKRGEKYYSSLKPFWNYFDGLAVGLPPTEKKKYPQFKKYVALLLVSFDGRVRKGIKNPLHVAEEVSELLIRLYDYEEDTLGERAYLGGGYSVFIRDIPPDLQLRLANPNQLFSIPLINEVISAVNAPWHTILWAHHINRTIPAYRAPVSKAQKERDKEILPLLKEGKAEEEIRRRAEIIAWCYSIRPYLPFCKLLKENAPQSSASTNLPW